MHFDSFCKKKNILSRGDITAPCLITGLAKYILLAQDTSLINYTIMNWLRIELLTASMVIFATGAYNYMMKKDNFLWRKKCKKNPLCPNINLAESFRYKETKHLFWLELIDKCCSMISVTKCLSKLENDDLSFDYNFHWKAITRLHVHIFHWHVQS